MEDKTPIEISWTGKPQHLSEYVQFHLQQLKWITGITQEIWVCSEVGLKSNSSIWDAVALSYTGWASSWCLLIGWGDLTCSSVFWNTRPEEKGTEFKCLYGLFEMSPAGRRVEEYTSTQAAPNPWMYLNACHTEQII